MARNVIKVNLELDRIHCHDEGDGWGNAEPYLWTVFFKIDGETVQLTEALKLSGPAVRGEVSPASPPYTYVEGALETGPEDRIMRGL